MSKKIRRRFATILIVYTFLSLAIWFFYNNTLSSYVSRNTRETIEQTKNYMLTDLGDEFARLRAATTVIAGSVYVQEFLSETDIASYYEKALSASEIIRQTIYPQTGGDIIFTISSNGALYRFTGIINTAAMERVYTEAVNNSTTTYTVIELDETDYFCITTPVFLRGSFTQGPVGYIAALSNLSQARRMFTKWDTMTGIESAVIADGIILFSSDPALDGKSIDELYRLYGSVSMEQVAGSNLYVVTAVADNVLHFGERLFIMVSFIVFAVLLVTLALLYRVLLSQTVSPMIKTADNMRMGLLKTQIDAHFVVNTVSCIEGLARQGQNDKVAVMAANLAGMLKSRHETGDEVNVFAQMEDVQRYIEIMNIRSGGKFIVNIDVDESLFRCRMPARVLQPLVENALTHGLGNKENDCRLTISGKLDTGRILFEIADNGNGMPAQALTSLKETLESGGGWENDKSGLKGVALVNTQGRIRALYGDNYGITLQNIPSGGFSALVKLPVIRE
jgi:hypothetical protein